MREQGPTFPTYARSVTCHVILIRIYWSCGLNLMPLLDMQSDLAKRVEVMGWISHWQALCRLAQGHEAEGLYCFSRKWRNARSESYHKSKGDSSTRRPCKRQWGQAGGILIG